MPPILPFSILAYQHNPSFWQTNQALTVSPSPGFSATSYSLNGPSLPSGVVFNTTTGVFSGTPTELTSALVYTVTATLANSTTTECQVTISIVDTPPVANLVNQASATGLNNLKLIAEQNFLADIQAMINNANALGKFSINADLGPYVSFSWVYFYLTSLNFTVVNLFPSESDFNYMSFFGGLPTFAGFPEGPFGPWFDDFTQFPASVRSKPPRRVLISWSQFGTNQLCTFPYIPFYGV